MVEETPKIFGGPFRVGVTCVRVPVLRAHCESMWPHVKRAYAEADGRSAVSCDKLRAELERVVELVQLAAGGEFTRVWRSDEDVPAHAVGLVRFLAALPATRA